MKSSNVAARMLACCLLTALMLGSLAPEQAVAQRFKILPFGQQKTEKQETLALSEKAGPWLIMCASFAGVDGQESREELFRGQTHLFPVLVMESKVSGTDFAE